MQLLVQHNSVTAAKNSKMNRRLAYKLFAVFMVCCVVLVPKSQIYKEWKIDAQYREHHGSRIYSLINLHFHPHSHFDNSSTTRIPACQGSPSATLKRKFIQHKHVAFIKTHRCASTTVQNLFMRYGLKNNLTFLLPRDGGNHIGWPKPFDVQTHMRNSTKPPDVLCYHSVFSQSLKDIMPKDSFYVTILRDPFDQVISLYLYFKWVFCTKMSLSELLQDVPTRKFVCDSPFYNSMIFDLGYPMEAMMDSDRVEEYIAMLDTTFHLVMIFEYLDESLIILRDMLGWTTRDILTFKKNEQQITVSNNANVSASIQLSLGNDLQDTPEDRAKVYEVMQADARLYNYFKKKLECIVDKNKEYIDREVEELRRIRQWWMDFCTEKQVASHTIKDERFKGFGNVAGYILTEQGKNNQSCIDMAISELALVAKINEHRP